MQAIILAAGMGKRLGELTQNNTKCMVKVNGVTLIERLLRQIDNITIQPIERIIVVTGYEGKKLAEYINTLDIKTPIHFVDNPIYDSTNNIYSLALAKEYLLSDDTLLFESDLIFEDAVVNKLLEDSYPSLALVSKYESWMDGTVVKLGKDYTIEKFIPGTEFSYDECDSYYKTVNIYKFSKDFSTTHYVPFLNAYCSALGNNEYYEQVLRVITLLNKPEIKALPLNNEAWYEIDDIQDLNIAESIFCPGAEKMAKLEQRGGGYWRYPALIDFCYAQNPYFPNERLLAELKANFERLVCDQASYMPINNLLAGKDLGIRPQFSCVGNRTEEIILAALTHSTGKVAGISHEYKDYSAHYCALADAQMYQYSAQDIIAAIGDANYDTLIIQNPDRNTGNLISKADMLRLCADCAAKHTRLIVDETYMDLADNAEENTLLNNADLQQNEHLAVVKGLSEAYGVPGLNVGMMASADTNWLQTIKKHLPLRNISSISEFFLQIVGKYDKVYRVACQDFNKERERFLSALRKIPNVEIIPSQGKNFICKIKTPHNPANVAQRLLNDYNIIVKLLYHEADAQTLSVLRIAVRSENDNNLMILALNQLLQS